MKTLESATQTTDLAPAVTALQQVLGDNLVSLVLFGSRARGDARPESDWDLLLIAKNLPSPFFARHLYLKKILPVGWAGQLSVLAKTVDEFDAGIPALFLDIALDGLILYDPNGYATQRLSYLKKLIQQKGLHHQQQGTDLIWHWQHFPGFNWQLTWNEKL